MIIIKTKNLELTDALKIFIEKKVGKLQRFIKKFESEASENGKMLAEIFVEVEKVTKHHRKGDVFRTEIIIVLPGKKLMAEAHGSDFSKTVIDAKDELEIEIKKYKFKTTELLRRKQRKMKNLSKI